MIPDYIVDIGRVNEICNQFRDHVRREFFTESNGSWSSWALKYHWPYLPSAGKYIRKLSRLVEICDLFGVKKLESSKSELQRRIHALEEERDETKYWKNFESLIESIAEPFASCKEELNRLQGLLEPKEKERVNEAIHVYMEEAYYSSVAMSVSAIEHRLLMLMKKTNPKESSDLDKMTFGALINEYLEHKDDKYAHMLPSRHEPLLELCNTYRIFSVHPKQEEINRKVATSVLNLTLEFLLDEKTMKQV